MFEKNIFVGWGIFYLVKKREKSFFLKKTTFYFQNLTNSNQNWKNNQNLWTRDTDRKKPKVFLKNSNF